MVRLKTRDGKLYAEYYQEGKRVRKSLKLDNTPNNVAYANRNIIPEYERNLEHGIKEMKPFKYFSDKVLRNAKRNNSKSTHRAYGYAVSMFFNFFDEDLLVNKIFTRDIEEYIEWMEDSGLSTASISAYLIPILMSFDTAIRYDYILKNPVKYAKKPKVVNKKKTPLTLLQSQNMLNRASGHLLTFLYFAFYTGARPNEILALTYGDIGSKFIHINKTAYNTQEHGTPKHESIRDVFLLEPLAKYLETLDKKSPGERIIPIAYDAMRVQFNALAEEVGAKGATPHVTRHTFTSMLIGAKTNPTLVQWLLGHKDLTMINKVYTHYMEKEDDAQEIESILKGIAQ